MLVVVQRNLNDLIMSLVSQFLEVKKQKLEFLLLRKMQYSQIVYNKVFIKIRDFN